MCMDATRADRSGKKKAPGHRRTKRQSAGILPAVKLPSVEIAEVPEAKVARYLLSEDHPDGRSKAAFFTSFGFDRDRWEELAGALKGHAAEHEIAFATDTSFGTKYQIEGPLVSPDGRSPNVIVIWFVDRGADRPRLVTAFPGPRPRLAE